MGQEINADCFHADDFNEFHQRLTQETQYLQKLIDQEQCSQQPLTAGFEIEAWLIDDAMQASPNNISFLENLNDPLGSWK